MDIRNLAYVILCISTGLILGCATASLNSLPEEWGSLKSQKDGRCLEIDGTFQNAPAKVSGSSSMVNMHLSEILFPVLDGIDISRVGVKTLRDHIEFSVDGYSKKYEIKDDGIVQCSGRTWMISESELSGGEGSLRVSRATVYLHLNESDDLIVRRMITSKGVDLLIVPRSEQDASNFMFYRLPQG